jgi:hypothetical protein
MILCPTSGTGSTFLQLDVVTVPGTDMNRGAVNNMFNRYDKKRTAGSGLQDQNDADKVSIYDHGKSGSGLEDRNADGVCEN